MGDLMGRVKQELAKQQRSYVFRGIQFIYEMTEDEEKPLRLVGLLFDKLRNTDKVLHLDIPMDIVQISKEHITDLRRTIHKECLYGWELVIHNKEVLKILWDDIATPINLPYYGGANNPIRLGKGWRTAVLRFYTQKPSEDDWTIHLESIISAVTGRYSFDRVTVADRVLYDELYKCYTIGGDLQYRERESLEVNECDNKRKSLVEYLIQCCAQLLNTDWTTLVDLKEFQTKLYNEIGMAFHNADTSDFTLDEYKKWSQQKQELEWLVRHSIQTLKFICYLCNVSERANKLGVDLYHSIVEKQDKGWSIACVIKAESEYRDYVEPLKDEKGSIAGIDGEIRSQQHHLESKFWEARAVTEKVDDWTEEAGGTSLLVAQLDNENEGIEVYEVDLLFKRMSAIADNLKKQ